MQHFVFFLDPPVPSEKAQTLETIADVLFIASLIGVLLIILFITLRLLRQFIPAVNNILPPFVLLRLLLFCPSLVFAYLRFAETGTVDWLM